jgi:hypothetical protein
LQYAGDLRLEKHGEIEQNWRLQQYFDHNKAKCEPALHEVTTRVKITFKAFLKKCQNPSRGQWKIELILGALFPNQVHNYSP